jgi:uncharacterized protein (DUF58 family)
MYFMVTGLILAVAIYAQASLLYWAFGLMVGGLIVSVVLAWLMMSGLTVQRVQPSHGVAGEAMVLRYQLTNHKRWLPAFGVVIAEGWGKGLNGWRRTGPLEDAPRKLKGRPHGWVLHLGPNQQVQAEAPCWPLRRGHLQFEKILVSTSFPFGVIRRILEFPQPLQMLVYPHLYRMNRRVLFSLSEADPQGRKMLERAGGHEEFFGLREYRAGDSLKTIDWKRSAKTGKLVSREMTQPSPPKIMVALDLTLPDAEEPQERSGPLGMFRSRRKTGEDREVRVERAVSLTASLVCDAYFHGYQVGLMVMGVPCTPFPVHHSLPHRTRILEALSQLDTDLTVDAPTSLPSYPSVVVRAGDNGDVPPGSRGRPAMLISAMQMEQFVLELDQGSSSLLGQRARPQSRRHGMSKEQSPWD